jgi:hypothetical protein
MKDRIPTGMPMLLVVFLVIVVVGPEGVLEVTDWLSSRP